LNASKERQPTLPTRRLEKTGALSAQTETAKRDLEVKKPAGWTSAGFFVVCFTGVL
jgi:hypothetical protein